MKKFALLFLMFFASYYTTSNTATPSSAEKKKLLEKLKSLQPLQEKVGRTFQKKQAKKTIGVKELIKQLENLKPLQEKVERLKNGKGKSKLLHILNQHKVKILFVLGVTTLALLDWYLEWGALSGSSSWLYSKFSSTDVTDVNHPTKVDCATDEIINSEADKVIDTDDIVEEVIEPVAKDNTPIPSPQPDHVELNSEEAPALNLNPWNLAENVTCWCWRKTIRNVQNIRKLF